MMEVQLSDVQLKRSSMSRSMELPEFGGGGRTPRAPRAPGTDPFQDAYFTELLSHSLDRLAREPQLLAEEQAQLRGQAQEAAVVQYPAFLATAGAAAAAHGAAVGAVQHLNSLASDLSGLAAAATAFSDSASELVARRVRTKQLQAAQGPLAEVLEVPALMDTCIRNGHFEEALDLRAFVGTLAFAHGDVPVVATLKESADAAAETLKEALLTKLRGQLQLPDCLRVIGYLRRLAIFDEQELRTQFLACREVWLAALVAEVDVEGGASVGEAGGSGGGSGYDALRRLTDIHRLHLFDAVMQFRAVFADEDPKIMEAAGAWLGADGGLLYAWAGRRIHIYMLSLKALLPQVGEGGSLGAALEHCMYAGAALSRVGLDFRAALPPLFESRVLLMFTRTVANAVETFAASLETQRWLPSPSSASRTRRLSPQEGAESGSAPPYALMESAALALFANGVAAALNELRHCAPLSLQQPVTQVIQESINGLMAALVEYGETRVLGAAEKPLFISSARLAIKVLAPHTASCLARVYRGAAVSLDIATAAAPLSGLLASWETPQQPQLQ